MPAAMPTSAPIPQSTSAPGPESMPGLAPGPTSLMAAIRSGDVETVKRLVQQGADVNSVNPFGDTPLATAINAGSAEILQILTDAGANVRGTDGAGNSFIHLALRQDNADLVRVLTSAGADPNEKDAIGNPAIQVAIVKNQPEIVRFLVNGGADVNGTNSIGNPVIHEAIGLGADPEILRILVEGGADVNAIEKPGRFSLGDEETALGQAVRLRNLEIVRILVDAGADIRARSRPFGNSAIEIAIGRRDAQMILILKPRSADQAIPTGGTGPPPAAQGPGFPEGESTPRAVFENAPPGINAGDPVSAEGGEQLTYALGGADTGSFVIIADTVQIRTREGIVYDHERKNRYPVTVSVEGDNAAGGVIGVTIFIKDLAPVCEPLRGLRTNHGDGTLTVRWSPAPQREGTARVLGYETELRRGEDGAWTHRRTFLGRNVGSMVYEVLETLSNYWTRVRPITTEGDCGWSPPVFGIPTEYLAPIYPQDRFRTEPVGTTERNWRFLTQHRCRYAVGGLGFDADCRYRNTGPDTSRIRLEFDDPSLGSCEVSLAYSSLTSGSFLDECFEAGVNTEVPFDRGLRMPSPGPLTERETHSLRAPRSQEEFNVLAWGRGDFIPGLFIGCPPMVSRCEFNPRQAFRVERDPESGLPNYVHGDYMYENTGLSQATITFRETGGDGYVFGLDFDPSSQTRVTITDDKGGATDWSGMPHLDLTLGPQPVLLPIPPSWSAVIAIESDFAPGTSEYVDEARRNLLWPNLVGPLIERAICRSSSNCAALNFQQDYLRLGRNRAIPAVEFPPPPQPRDLRQPRGSGEDGNEDAQREYVHLRSVVHGRRGG